MEHNKPALSLQQLLDEPKGKLTFRPDEIFLLHVFWEAPSLAAAQTVLKALKRCAEATHRDTPCVPTYHFRPSSLNREIVSQEPRTVGQHVQLQEAIKKLKVGVSRPAVVADLVRRGIDPDLLDAEPDASLPSDMQQNPVMIEFTELYLDERSFYEHAGSRDYLDAYGVVMQPGLMNRQATVRLGTPTADIVEKILDPMLKAKHEPVPANCHLWRAPVTVPESGVFLSMDAIGSVDDVMEKLPLGLRENSTTCVGFVHPFQEERVRIICILPQLPTGDMLTGLSQAPLKRVEAHCQEKDMESLRQMVAGANLDGLMVLRSTESGYAIHEKACNVTGE